MTSCHHCFSSSRLAFRLRHFCAPVHAAQQARPTFRYPLPGYGASQVAAAAVTKRQVAGSSGAAQAPAKTLPDQQGTYAGHHAQASKTARKTARDQDSSRPLQHAATPGQQQAPERTAGLPKPTGKVGSTANSSRRGWKRIKKKKKAPVREFFDLDDDEVAEPDGQMLAAEWGGFAGVPAALGPVPSQQLVRAHDKNRLKPAQRAELARRLRREAPELGVLTGYMRVLRVYRFALDDLRLFKAIHQAGMEGRVVVVDDPAHAHVVVSSHRTRTGRDVPAENARNLAAKLDIPHIQLEKVSGYTLMDALCSIMGVPMPAHLLSPRTPPLPILPASLPTASESQQVAQVLQGGPAAPPTQEPHTALQRKNAQRKKGRQQHEEDGWLIEETASNAQGKRPAWRDTQVAGVQLQPQDAGSQPGAAPASTTIAALLRKVPQKDMHRQTREGGNQQHASGRGIGGNATQQSQAWATQHGRQGALRPSDAIVAPPVPAQLASLLQQQQQGTLISLPLTKASQGLAHQHQTSSGQPSVSSLSVQGSAQPWQPVQQGIAASPQPAVSDLDVEDHRRSLLPSNPTARIGSKYRIVRPMRHCAKVKLKAALKRAAEQNATW